MTQRLLTLLIAASAGCTGVVDPTASDPMGSGSGSGMMDADIAVARAMEWVEAKLPYCQAANHQRDYDSACAMTCERPDNPDWDAYRSDCSGLVSYAWGLPAPGRVTSTFAPFDTAVSHVIDATALMPGDAVNNSEHMMLFKEWVMPGSQAVFIEEPGCSSSTPYAHEFTATVTTDGHTIVVKYHGTFTAIRYDGAT